MEGEEMGGKQNKERDDEGRNTDLKL